MVHPALPASAVMALPPVERASFIDTPANHAHAFRDFARACEREAPRYPTFSGHFL